MELYPFQVSYHIITVYNGNLPFDIKDVGTVHTTLLNTTSTWVADGTNSCLRAIEM